MSAFQLHVAKIIGRVVPPLFAQRLRLFIYPHTSAMQDQLNFTAPALTGSLLHGRTDDYYYWHFVAHGYYDWRNVAIARALCRPGDRLIEVGANVGTETINYSDLVGQEGCVFAFEPVPTNVERLKHAVSEAHHPNIVLHPVAVADSVGSVRFRVYEHQSGVGYIDTEGRDGKSIEVECVTLDSLLDTFGTVRGIFIDAEGSDVQVLWGAQTLLQRDQPFVVLEVSRKVLQRGGFDLHDVIAALPSYQFFRVTRLGLAKVGNLVDEPKAANWLCLPNRHLGDVERVSARIRRVGLMPMGWGIQ